MSGDLRVTTAHVRDLADKQDRAAAQITAATVVTKRAEALVRSTHGSIASATASCMRRNNSRKLGLSDKSQRSATVLAKNPATSRSSARARLAMTEPTAKSSCPV